MNLSYLAEDMHAEAAELEAREALHAFDANPETLRHPEAGASELHPSDMGDEDDIDPRWEDCLDEHGPEDRYLDSHWEDAHEPMPEFFGGE